MLQELLREQEVDIALISETRLKVSDSFKIANYCGYFEYELGDAGAAIRGLAVLVKRNIIHQLITRRTLQTISDLNQEFWGSRSVLTDMTLTSTRPTDRQVFS